MVALCCAYFFYVCHKRNVAVCRFPFYRKTTGAKTGKNALTKLCSSCGDRRAYHVLYFQHTITANKMKNHKNRISSTRLDVDSGCGVWMCLWLNRMSDALPSLLFCCWAGLRFACCTLRLFHFVKTNRKNSSSISSSNNNERMYTENTISIMKENGKRMRVLCVCAVYHQRQSRSKTKNHWRPSENSTKHKRAQQVVAEASRRKNPLTKSDGKKAKLEIEMLYRFAKFVSGWRSTIAHEWRTRRRSDIIYILFFIPFVIRGKTKQGVGWSATSGVCTVPVHTHASHTTISETASRELRVPMQFTWAAMTVRPHVARGLESTFINLGTWTTSPRCIRRPKPPLLFIMISFQFFSFSFLLLANN